MTGSLDDIAACLEAIQERPDLICKRKAHLRDPEQSSLATAREVARSLWLALRVLQLHRAQDDGTQVLCLKCFPDTAAGNKKRSAGKQPSDSGSTDSFDSSSSS